MQRYRGSCEAPCLETTLKGASGESEPGSQSRSRHSSVGVIRLGQVDSPRVFIEPTSDLTNRLCNFQQLPEDIIQKAYGFGEQRFSRRVRSLKCDEPNEVLTGCVIESGHFSSQAEHLPEAETRTDENRRQQHTDSVCPLGLRNDAIQLRDSVDDVIGCSPVGVRCFSQSYLLTSTVPLSPLFLHPPPAEWYFGKAQFVEHIRNCLKGTVDRICAR